MKTLQIILLASFVWTTGFAQQAPEKATPAKVTPATVTPAKAIKKFIPPPTVYEPLPTLAEIQNQMDVVIGKRTMTLSLLDDVTTWYKVDYEHPKAISQSIRLRQFLTSYFDESLKLEKMFFRVLPNETSMVLLSTKEKLLWDQRAQLILDATGREDIDSKLRQLVAMGFDPK